MHKIESGKELAGRTALITGAAGGIGGAVGELFAERGCQVALADLNGDGAVAFADRLTGLGYRAAGLTLDVTDRDSVAAAVARVQELYGGIDILVNNAGIGNFHSLTDATEEEWNRVIDINLSGTHRCTRAVLPLMVEAGYGKIVSIASLAAHVGGLKVAPDYVASKAGVIGLTKSYARYGSAHGILANAVAPGPTDTEMAAGHFTADEIPLKRLASPRDVAWAVFFLASPMSDFITGATLDVNGGMLMR